ncbi:MAG: glycosyltransferase family 4 protein [Opitutales bacterium]|nr:glycosyltransferase family 4 protein [Opitutales bacterium]
MTQVSRILFITSSYPEWIGGGALNYARGILEALSTRFSVDVLVADPNRSYRDWKLPDNLAYRHVHPDYFKLGRSTVAFPALIKKIASKFGLKTSPLPEPPPPYELTTAMKQTIKRWAAVEDYAIVIVNYFWMTPALDFFPNSLKVTLTHDVWHKHISVGDPRYPLLERLDAKTEASYLNKSDTLIAISEHDATIFRQFTTVKDPIISLPSFPSKKFDKKDSSLGSLVFASGYQPNIDGLNWLLNTVWPLVLQRAKSAQLSIGGQICKNLDSEQLPTGTQLIGGCLDPAEFYQHTQIAIVPILKGTGVKTKIIEALQFGIPVVTTPQGLLGIEFLTAYGVIIESCPDRFSQAITSLLENHGETKRLGKLNRTAFEKYFTTESANETLVKRFEKYLLSNNDQ